MKHGNVAWRGLRVRGDAVNWGPGEDPWVQVGTRHRARMHMFQLGGPRLGGPRLKVVEGCYFEGNLRCL